MKGTQNTNEAAEACPVDSVVMPIIKWRTGWRNEIERIECTKETDKCVWVTRWGDKPSRCDKNSKHEQYHDTWDAAHSYLEDRATNKVLSARRSLELANSFLGNVKGMRKPEGA